MPDYPALSKSLPSADATQDAQTAPPESGPGVPPPRDVDRLTIQEFRRNLVASRLLSSTELEAFEQRQPPEFASGSAAVFAQRLIAEQYLTSYQAQ